MGLYRKKPVVIEARQFWMGQPWPEGVCDCLAIDGPLAPHVHTAHGQQVFLESGDWITAEPNGNGHYPIKPDIFAATYEPAALAEPPSDDQQRYAEGERDEGSPGLGDERSYAEPPRGEPAIEGNYAENHAPWYCTTCGHHYNPRDPSRMPCGCVSGTPTPSSPGPRGEPETIRHPVLREALTHVTTVLPILSAPSYSADDVIKIVRGTLDGFVRGLDAKLSAPPASPGPTDTELPDDLTSRFLRESPSLFEQWSADYNKAKQESRNGGPESPFKNLTLVEAIISWWEREIRPQWMRGAPEGKGGQDGTA